MNEMKKKMYIAQLKYGTWVKNIYLEGDDTAENNKKFLDIMDELVDIAKNSDDWPDYIRNAIQHFSKNQFYQIHK